MSESKGVLTKFEVQSEPVLTDATANPFKLVVDPAMRVKLRKALFDLIENHDQEMAKYVAEGKLSLDSYKEYIEYSPACGRHCIAWMGSRICSPHAGSEWIRGTLICNPTRAGSATPGNRTPERP